MSVPNLTDAPGFRSINQLAAGRSGVQGVLAAADEIHGHTAELASLRQALDTINSRAERGAIAAKARGHDDRALLDIMAVIERVPARSDESARLSHDNSQLRAQADGLAEAYERLIAENAELHVRVQELTADADDVAETVNTLREIIERLREDLAAAKRYRRRLSKQIDSLRAQLSAAKP